MSAFLDAVLAHPEERVFVIELFHDELTAKKRCTWEFQQFYIHGLRWPEMRALVEAEWNRHRDDFRVLPILQHLREAFDDKWEDAEFYSRFMG